MNQQNAAQAALDELQRSEEGPDDKATLHALRALTYAVLATVPDVRSDVITHAGGPGVTCGFTWIDRNDPRLEHTCYQDHAANGDAIGDVWHQCSCGTLKRWIP